MIIFSNTARKTQPDRDPRIVHIDKWQQLADQKREDVLGKNFFEDTKTFFEMSENQTAPRFRPAVRIPELQLMCMKEANDLSEYQPQVYIYHHKSDKRMEKLEASFKAQWNVMQVPFHLLFSFIAMEFMGTGFLSFGIDPFANNNRGAMWVKWRDSKYCHTDPNADYTCNWSWAITEDWLHLDEVKRRFPESAERLPKSHSRQSPRDARNDEASSGFRLPDGPWQAMPPFAGLAAAQKGGSSRLRTTYMLDYTRELDGPVPSDPALAKYKWKYPRGRYIVDCEDVVLADGALPLRRFPLIPVWATPPMYGTWAVPPTRYTQGLQSLAEKTYSQTFENFYRMNNGIWLIPETAEINQGNFGGIPGEKATYKGQQPPTCVTPPQFPSSALQFPEQLLQKQRDLHGFTQARQGDPGAGNVSADLFDAAVLRGQSMTQLRGRMATSAVINLSQLMVYTMLEFMPSQKMIYKQGSKVELVHYEQPTDNLADYQLVIDDGDFHVKSQAAVARIAEALMTRGQIPVGKGLEMIGYPEADKVEQDQKESQALAAVTAVAEGKGGRK